MKITPALAKKLAALWRIELSDEVADVLPQPRLEYLVHELSHCAALKTKAPMSGVAIAAEIGALLTREQDLNEALACAIELEVATKVLGFKEFQPQLVKAAAGNLKYMSKETRARERQINAGDYGLVGNSLSEAVDDLVAQKEKDRQNWIRRKISTYRKQDRTSKMAARVVDWLREGMVRLGHEVST